MKRRKWLLEDTNLALERKMLNTHVLKRDSVSLFPRSVALFEATNGGRR